MTQDRQEAIKKWLPTAAFGATGVGMLLLAQTVPERALFFAVVGGVVPAMFVVGATARRGVA